MILIIILINVTGYNFKELIILIVFKRFFYLVVKVNLQISAIFYSIYNPRCLYILN